MYKVETHDNSSDYFKGISIDNDSMHITSTKIFSTMLRNLSGVPKDKSWKVIDIEKLIETIYNTYEQKINQFKIRSEIRTIIQELKLERKEVKILEELKYLEYNITILISDINFLAQAKLSRFNYSKESITKKTVGLIYNRLVNTQVYKEISNEILNVNKAKEFFRRIYKDNESYVNKLYFYNVNNLDLNRWLIIELLNLAGFEIIFRIPYFHGLKVINKCWDDVYGDKKIFDWSNVVGSCEERYKNSQFINFLEGYKNQTTRDEKVAIKTYSEVSYFRKSLKDKRIITFYKDSLGACRDTVDKENLQSFDSVEHYFETSIGRFLANLYSCKLKENAIEMEFDLYRELITSGWIEYNGWNGIKLSEYLSKNDAYFNRVKTIDEILERINVLKDLEDVNEIFEEQVKLRIKGDNQKKFLSNPFRALGYNNIEDYNITTNYMFQLTNRLKNIILKVFENDKGLVNTAKHFEALKVIFNNNYMSDRESNGSDIEKAVIRRINIILNNPNMLSQTFHIDDGKDLFSILLNIKNDDKDEKINIGVEDFSIDQLEAIIHINKMPNFKEEKRIYISDLSYKAYEKYNKNKYISGKILKDGDFEDIFEASLVDSELNLNKEIIFRGLKLRKQSINSTEAYLKFTFGNLFINFDGEKEFSWISGLRRGDSKAVILNQIETIYANKKSVSQGLDNDDIIKEEDIQNTKEQIYNIEELESSYEKYSDVAYRDLDFCDQKFLYSSILQAYPMYYTDFHNKLVFSSIVSILKNSISDSYFNISKFIFPLFPQLQDVVKQNVLTCEYGRKNIGEYRYFDNINYPKNIDAIYLLKSKYKVGENWKVKNRYKKGNFKAKEYYVEFLKNYLNVNEHNKGRHCMMCPHIYLCRKGEFVVDYKY